MKKFYKSLGGKIVLFLLCLICVAGAGMSCVGAYMLVASGYSVYSMDEVSCKEDAFTSELLMEKHLLLESHPKLDVENPSVEQNIYSNLIWEIRDKKGRLLASYGVEGHQEWTYQQTYKEKVDGKECTILMGLKPGFPKSDSFSALEHRIHLAYTFRYLVFIIGGCCVVLGIVSYILLLCGAGWNVSENRLVPGVFFRAPWDLMVALWGMGVILLLGLCMEVLPGEPVLLITGFVVLLIYGIGGFLGLSMETASRLKQSCLFQNSIIRKCWQLVKRLAGFLVRVLKRWLGFCGTLLGNLPILWKTLLILGVFTAAELLVLLATMWDPEPRMLLWFLEKLILIPAILYLVLNLRHLETGIRALAEGQLDHTVETEKILPILRPVAENLNSIGKGMTRAVEERLKSERMKTELITNVSHDIKTPLTSVINYGDLISREAEKEQEVDLNTIREYSQVLVRQSDRLKRLLEDLVEASKAATGNLEVELQICSASVFLDQISGEYQEKVEAAGLSLIQKLPEKELFIQADGRRMWRLFSNLMNNICKYSLPGSRVYLELSKREGRAVFTFKNTSREPLNMTEEELMERFTRGDSSRHTEGSGLGLSIAKSMADIQGGSLRINTDGDLFKAEAAFPLSR
ncbi:MAG: HAMP domain-containing sensor histidine kinase [Lachnospiraceae bacterium]|nr:HAMP domain-containing sensor histidine kinase [Lachnospiraceae bacterium]